MSTERAILPVVDPTVSVDPLYLEDKGSGQARENANPAVPQSTLGEDTTARAGSWTPVVAVRSIMFSDADLRSFSLSLDGKLPRVVVTVRDVQGKFSINFPLDGDVISVYLRPPDVDNQRPIRMDFDILNVSSSASQLYTFSGVLKVPGLFGEVCRAFPSASSYEHLQDVCETLGLGFASNETGTNDAMTRVCPYDTYETFIHDTVRTAYANDDSFFTWYVDPYYYLCLVNVNKQFSLDDKLEDVNISLAVPAAGRYDQAGTKDTIKGSLVLTNRLDRKGMNNFIESFNLENNSADVWIQQGYKRTGQYYDMDRDSPEYVQTFVDPLTTDGAAQDQVLLKGRVDEDNYQLSVKYKWLGKQHARSDGGNVHDSYLFAGLLNHQNMAEIGKTVLKVCLAGMNFYVGKYSRVPVLIYQSGTNPKNAALLRKRDADLNESGETGDPSAPFNRTPSDNANSPNDGLNEGDQTKNEFLSGWYVVAGVEYRYSAPGPVKQVLTLVRREWPIPARNKDV